LSDATNAGRNPTIAATVALLAIAVALRCWDYGNPVIHVDEQYYLLVGDRLLHGAVPYISIWDRKPIGLFLLFAAIRTLPGDGVLAYQLVATAFALATAWIVHGSARHLGASRAGAFAAAALYLLWLPLLGGRGGQAPVFYNLLIAAATRLTLRLPDIVDRPHPRRRMLLNGLAVCLLGGVAIQIKYTAAVEAAYLGAAHVWYRRRIGAGSVSPMIADTTVWLLAGLAPTLIALGSYAATGAAALRAFSFANFVSIGMRPGYPWSEIAMRLLGIGVILSPLLAAAMLAWRWRARTGIEREPQRIALGELAAALAGFLAIGTFFDHYALPLIAPLCTVAAPALGRRRKLLIGAFCVGLLIFAVERARLHDDAAGARAVARIVHANSGGGCPYVFIGDTVTYELADSCLPTAYVFPNFLAYNTEQGATGIDEAAEVGRILANRPPVIVTSTRRLSIWNRQSLAELKTALAQHYRPVFSAPRENYRTIVYLRDGRPFRDAAR
jgi:hypothetical protein